MLKFTAALVVAFLSVGAFASPQIELLCYVQTPTDPTWRPYGGNPVGCHGTYTVSPAGIAQCNQEREWTLDYLNQNHSYGGKTFVCSCTITGLPNGDPGGGNEGW